jgi:hypothetical protein
MGGWMDGWVGVKAVLRIAYSNQQIIIFGNYYFDCGKLYKEPNSVSQPASQPPPNFFLSIAHFIQFWQYLSIPLPLC